MPTQNLIQRQHEIIQRSHSIINDYERGRSNAEARLKRDKETAESTWKRDKEVAETAWKRDKETIGDWSRARSQADSTIKSVREAIESAQDVLKRTKWQGKLAGGTPLSLAIPNNSSFVVQMAEYRSASDLARNEIELLLRGYKPNSWQNFGASLLSGILISFFFYLRLIILHMHCFVDFQII